MKGNIKFWGIFFVVYVFILSLIFNNNSLSYLNTTKIIKTLNVTNFNKYKVNNNNKNFDLEIPLNPHNNGTSYTVSLKLNNTLNKLFKTHISLYDVNTNKLAYKKLFNIKKGRSVILAKISYETKDTNYKLKIESSNENIIKNIKISQNNVTPKIVNASCYVFQALIYSIILFAFILFTYIHRKQIFNLKNIRDFFLVSLITLILLGYIYNNFNWDFVNVPIYFLGLNDAHCLAVLKNAMQGNSYWHIPNLGAPFGTNVYYYPILMGFYYYFGRLLGIFTNNVIFVNNLYLILTFILSSFGVFIIARIFKINYFLAILGGLLFSISQNHLIRNGLHVQISSYFVNIIVFYYCFKIVKDEKFNNKLILLNDKLKLYIGLILGAFLLGSVEIYYAYFGLIFLTLSVFISLFNKRYTASIRGLLFIFLIFICLANSLLPAIINAILNGATKSAVRSPSEAFYYGLMLVHLFKPYNVTSSHIFSAISNSYDKVMPFKGEVLYNYLGILGGIGFLLLLLFLLVEPFKNIIQKYEKQENRGTLSLISILNIFALLVGFQSGIGIIIYLMGLTQFRAYNRISVYILLFSVFTLIYLLDIFFKRAFKNKTNVYVAIFSLFLLYIHIVDINPSNLVQDFNTNKEKVNNVKEYAKNLDDYYKDGAKILQLPVLLFVDNYVRDDFTNCNYQVWPYLFTKNIRYSFGAFKNTKEFFMQNALFDDNNIENVVSNAKNYGFNGISVNTDIYDNSDVVASLKNLLGEPKIVSKLGNILLFDLKDYKSNKEVHFKNINLIENDSNIISGFSGLERGKDFYIRWAVLDENFNLKKNNGINSYIYYIPPKGKSYKIVLNVHSEIDNTLKVYVNNNKVGDFKIEKGDSIFETKTILKGSGAKKLEPSVLMLEHSKSFRPSSFDNKSIDKRILTLAYKEILVKILE